MKVSIDKFSKVPVYLQIADQIKSQIISGALPRGSCLLYTSDAADEL